jgi:hypothetical protein
MYMSNLGLETLVQLKKLADARADWGEIIEDYVDEFGGINPAKARGLSDEQLKKLWWAPRFAETGAPGLSKPQDGKWQYVQAMTGFLADRSISVGERICGARIKFGPFFKNLPANVILRSLLILEAGKFGTVTTKDWINRLLSEIGEQDLEFDDPASITLALCNLKALISKVAPELGATTIGFRARIPWHLCQIIESHSGVGEANPIRELVKKTVADDIEEILSNTKISQTTKELLVKARVGQGQFGLQVRKNWKNRCSVTGSSTHAALEASHIKRWSDSSDAERLDPNNGLLLTANLHKLFDAGLIAFEDSGPMLVSPQLSPAERKIFGVVGQTLATTPSPRVAKYLAYHKDNTFDTGIE